MIDERVVTKCVTIRKYQEEFINNQSRGFKLSRFLQAKLDDYIKLRNDYKEFMEKEVDNGETKTE